MIGLIVLVVLLVSARHTQRRYLSILPEAEVKIQLALYKLEHRHYLKTKKNDEHR